MTELAEPAGLYRIHGAGSQARSIIIYIEGNLYSVEHFGTKGIN